MDENKDSAADGELLDFAAIAAGIDEFQHWNRGGALYWNPLHDDGQAQRLAAKLELDVMHRVVGGRRVEVLPAGGPLIQHFYEGDICAAARRAIVLGAAAIGRRHA